MSDLRPIPIPWTQRWRSFRYRLFPILIVAAAGAASLWLLKNDVGQSASVVGMARGRVFQVSASYAGRVKSIPVRLFERVTRGQVVAVMDDEVLAAQIATISAEITRLRAEHEQERNVLAADIANRQSEWVAENRAFAGDIMELSVKMSDLRTALAEDRAMVKGLLQAAENASKLVAAKALSEIEFQTAQAAHDAMAAKIQANEEMLKRLEAERKAAQERMDGYTRHQPVMPSGELALEHLDKAIRVQEGLMRELSAQRADTVLRAPIDGIVTEVQGRAGDAAMRRPGEGVLRRVGEVVAVGEPILAIAETSPSEIIAYAAEHQATTFREGSAVEIRTRARRVQLGRSQAVAIAPTLERLPERLWANPQAPAWGRPFVVSIPAGMDLSPGELVWVRRR